MKKCLISLSGGVDSAVVLAECMHNKQRDPYTVSFNYGSKHNPWENHAAHLIADHYGVPWRCIDLSQTFANFKSHLLASGPPVPHGHYEAESMRQTVVPFRNGIFLSVLAGLAESLGCEEVWLGIHAGDHHIYPDCRPQFFEAMKAAVEYGTDEKVTLYAPYLYSSKGYIIGEGIAMQVPFHLTRTCYANQPVACGKCGSCQERLASFRSWNYEDPIEYETREILPKGS